ncbi:AcrR family transcriptional regulator [Pseudomonas sp. JUb42]|uniref:TetR/AcrR family transcriptional regulator n=1 Tax=Pseudomonas sp. JUb42 TaxID=2940611 RepID=UPI0021672B25|nr:TetR/AcrR family transcriptional regulator [Pseudomonas sp. JUb42]MCS3467510.1 AcrR family transcriptional regulator [Pseudomonas sp. JUb42]
MPRPRKFDEGVALDQAMVVFWTLGYDGASMAELTKAMGMNAPSVYFAFGSKRGLFDAVLERYDERRSHHKDSLLTAATAREAAERMLFGAIEWLTDPDEPPGCLLVQSGLASGIASQDVCDELVRRRSRVSALLTALFEKGQSNGNLVDTADAAQLADYVQLVFSGLCVQAAAGTSRTGLQSSAHLALAGLSELWG